jgi:hypothetical protein
MHPGWLWMPPGKRITHSPTQPHTPRPPPHLHADSSRSSSLQPACPPRNRLQSFPMRARRVKKVVIGVHSTTDEIVGSPRLNDLAVIAQTETKKLDRYLYNSCMYQQLILMMGICKPVVINLKFLLLHFLKISKLRNCYM